MKQPDGFNGYEGGAPYWILPSGQKTYDYEEWRRADEEYWKSRNEQDDKRSPNKARRG